jgi:hypothetical protein
MGGDWLRTDGKIHSEQNSNLHSSLDVAEVLTAILSLVEFEQHGEDRAKYGDNLINRLAKDINRKGFEPRTLRLYRRIYLIYPQLGTEIGTYLHNNSLGVLDASGNSIWQSATAKLQTSGNQEDGILQTVSAKLEE